MDYRIDYRSSDPKSNHRFTKSIRHYKSIRSTTNRSDSPQIDPIHPKFDRLSDFPQMAGRPTAPHRTIELLRFDTIFDAFSSIFSIIFIEYPIFPHPELSNLVSLQTRPSVPVLSGQDFEPVNVGRNATSNRVVVPKSAAGVDRLKAMGMLSTEKKFGGGSNSSAHSGATINARKIEESDELKINKVDKSLSKAIQQARMAKKLTQKELATKINEKPQVVGEYENGKAVPNAQIINKLERELGVKLPRPGKKPVDPAKKAAAAGGVGTRGGLVAGGPPKRR